MDQPGLMQKCRICLGEYDDDETLFDIFKETHTNEGDTLKLSKKVEYCCGVRIRETPEMPSKLCIKCFEMTQIWFNFRQMCINSQVYLESLCTDRTKPPELLDADEGEYLEYLLEELQTVRQDVRDSSLAFDINQDTDGDIKCEDTENSDDDYIDTIPLNESEEDSDIELIMQNIKKEKDDTHEGRSLRQKRNQTEVRTRTQKTNRDGLKRQRAPSPASYMCSICGNVYTKKAAFTYHMSLHSNVKPHECEICGKAFRQVCELKNHMRRHTGEKPYKCSYCDRHFIDRSEKHRHERVHTNTRPYVCTVCGKSFMYSAILKNHSKLHSGEKDYNCLVCQKAFTLQHQLKAHLQTLTHKQKEAQCVSAGYEVVYE